MKSELQKLIERIRQSVMSIRASLGNAGRNDPGLRAGIEQLDVSLAQLENVAESLPVDSLKHQTAATPVSAPSAEGRFGTVVPTGPAPSGEKLSAKGPGPDPLGPLGAEGTSSGAPADYHGPPLTKPVTTASDKEAAAYFGDPEEDDDDEQPARKSPAKKAPAKAVKTAAKKAPARKK